MMGILKLVSQIEKGKGSRDILPIVHHIFGKTGADVRIHQCKTEQR